MEEGYSEIVQHLLKQMDITKLDNVRILYVYCMYIVLGGVACYNSGWGCYSNNYYLFTTLLILY